MQHHPWCCIFFVQLNDEALFSTSCQRRKSQETSINPGVSVEFDMNDAEINRYALREAQARETPASRTMIKYPEQKLTEPEMLVLFELSVLVKHISEMGLHLVANHL